MKGTTIDASTRLWPVFSVRMVAEVSAASEQETRERLDQLVDRGVLARWSQWGSDLPDVYYHATAHP